MPLGPTARQEPEQHSFEFMSLNRDLPVGALLYTTPPASTLKQHIQIPHHLNVELDFAVDFCLPFPAASS